MPLWQSMQVFSPLATPGQDMVVIIARIHLGILRVLSRNQRADEVS